MVCDVNHIKNSNYLSSTITIKRILLHSAHEPENVGRDTLDPLDLFLLALLLQIVNSAADLLYKEYK